MLGECSDNLTDNFTIVSFIHSSPPFYSLFAPFLGVYEPSHRWSLKISLICGWRPSADVWNIADVIHIFHRSLMRCFGPSLINHEGKASFLVNIQGCFCLFSLTSPELEKKQDADLVHREAS